MMMRDRLQQLLNIYFSGKLTEDQRGELVSLLETDEAAGQFADLVQQQLSGNEFSVAGDLHRTENGIVEGVIKKIQSSPAVPIHRARFSRKWGWAAAAILIISSGTWLWRHSLNVHPSPAADNRHLQYDIAPGSDKAVLTLSDGTAITLDSAANGAIAQQGNASVVKLDDGRISYQLKDASAGAVMMNTLHTPRGGQYQLTLPDGTQVWLNAASSITYPAAFGEKTRTVAISGEAYFEVAKNKSKPFIVDVDGRSSVEVLGTHFNVNSYANEGSIKTTLLEGSVKIGDVILSPGQQAQVSGRQVSVANNTNIDKVMAWKNGLFNFDDAGLEEVMRQIERWYNVDVIYEKGIPNIRFEGEISKNINLSGLLKVLARAEVKYRIEEGRRLVVLP